MSKSIKLLGLVILSIFFSANTLAESNYVNYKTVTNAENTVTKEKKVKKQRYKRMNKGRYRNSSLIEKDEHIDRTPAMMIGSSPN